MNPIRFDQIAKHLATRPLTRRRTLAAAAGSALAALTGATRGTRAQAAPTATPSATGTGLAANNATLFVQTASGGTFQPNPQAGQPLPTPASATPAAIGTPVAAKRGDYLLTLTGHSGETIAFSDRPERNFGEVPTAKFFTSMGFTPANPPNAALVADSPQQQDDVLLVELFHPAYDAVTQTLTYDATILTQYTGELLKPLAAKQADQRIAAQFDSASLFIDDCPDANIVCFQQSTHAPVGDLGFRGMCWDWNQFRCLPCDPDAYSRECNATIPACEGQCYI